MNDVAHIKFLLAVKTTGWSAEVLEKTRDGYYLKISRTTNRHRWRWYVAKIERQLRPTPSRLSLSFAQASGFARSCERAMRMAEVAVDGLLKGEAK